MRKMIWLLAAFLPLTAFLSVRAPKTRLSDYGFFSGDIRLQQPAAGVIPYSLNTPLFSDHAEKLRFVRVPEGQIVSYNDTATFDFPVGTALVKTFYFPVDARDASKGRRLMETRVLLHEANGWKAYPYIWNEEQTDALLDVAGETKQVTYIDEQGKKRNQAYLVPNMNQCKGCHNQSEKLKPIGPSAWQLNGDHTYAEGASNQLRYWVHKGILSSLPDILPKGVRAYDPESGTVEERARIWLDINCAHCHRAEGPASSSGLYLSLRENDPLKLGILKTPVAAGRASGKWTYDIVPGKPEESILLHRMRSTDPGVMMPELGRTVVDEKGMEIVKSWILEIRF